MRRGAIMGVLLSLFGSAIRIHAAEPAQRPQVVLEIRVVERDLHDGKTKVLTGDSRTMEVGGGEFFFVSRARKGLPPDERRMEGKFDRFSYGADFKFTAVSAITTDWTESQQAHLEVSFYVSEPRADRAKEYRTKEFTTVELGRPARMRLRCVEPGVEYLIEIRVKPFVGPRIIRS